MKIQHIYSLEEIEWKRLLNAYRYKDFAFIQDFTESRRLNFDIMLDALKTFKKRKK